MIMIMYLSSVEFGLQDCVSLMYWVSSSHSINTKIGISKIVERALKNNNANANLQKRGYRKIFFLLPLQIQPLVVLLDNAWQSGACTCESTYYRKSAC